MSSTVGTISSRLRVTPELDSRKVVASTVSPSSGLIATHAGGLLVIGGPCGKRAADADCSSRPWPLEFHFWRHLITGGLPHQQKPSMSCYSWNNEPMLRPLLEPKQFTAEAFTGVLKHHAITTSMDGKGRWVDNVVVEHLWRSVKYEDIYLKAYETPRELERGLDQYFRFYNARRRHTALGR